MSTETLGGLGSSDQMWRQEIVDSCRVVKAHASNIGVGAQKIANMPAHYTPACMDELNEAAGVLERALGRILDAKERLLAKPHLAAAE